ncbi:hypothetical protein CAPTEDRAFT_207090, partial [Capitella teleta]
MRPSTRRGVLLLFRAFLSGVLVYQVLWISTIMTKLTLASLADVREKPVITLFTTFASDALREPVTRLVIHNWATLRPAVQPVLFTTTGSGWAVEEALRHGWVVKRVPAVNARGTPFIKAMFESAYNLIDSHFYCFANGDLLFSESLVENIRAVTAFMNSNPNVSDADYTKPFVLGRRSDLAFNSSSALFELTQNPQSMWAQNRSTLAKSDAQDYFLTLRNGFPWDRVPDLVVGRVAVDNYLVLMARYHGMMTVDLTATNKVLHLKQRHFRPYRPDGGYNKELIQRLHPNGVPWALTTTTRARIGTKRDEQGRVIVTTRDGYIPFERGKYFEEYEKMSGFKTLVRKPTFQMLS